MQAELTAGTDVSLYAFNDGTQSVCAVIKRTYDMRPGARMRRSSRGEIPLFLEPVEEDGNGAFPVACLVHECDVVPRKPCTDIVVHGHVRSPGAVPIASMTAAVRIGNLAKRVQVFGDRRVAWQPGSRPVFSSPEPLVEMPLTWRRAYGGIDASLEIPDPTDLPELLAALTPEQHPGAYPRNPAGTGWAVNADARMIHGTLLPNFEDPDHLLGPDRLVRGARERWAFAPIPAGFGWISQTWFPRSTFLGIGPELPSELRAGWLAEPAELDDGPDLRFFSGASRGMRAMGLRGDEPVELQGFHHEGALTTALPGDQPDVIVAFNRKPLATSLRLHTIELFPDHAAASLVWVAEARPPRQLPVELPVDGFEDYELLEGVDVIIDGVALPRNAIG
jgi:hypothetical protein